MRLSNTVEPTGVSSRVEATCFELEIDTMPESADSRLSIFSDFQFESSSSIPNIFSFLV